MLPVFLTHNKYSTEHHSVRFPHYFAFVFTTASITATLSEHCWGTVQVCTHSGCGGVCAHTWTEANSEMLCKDLGCGAAFSGMEQNIKGEVSILAMFPTNHTTNLTESIIVKAEPQTNCDKTAFVVCQGKPIQRLEYSFLCRLL